ncbi:MAG: DUF1803 domain-containing protein [Lactobacillales bacterium]|jgi:hypothetical protein|nr:DUF1803 domain-containing protein [Lactobacillales bacterium]
MRNIINYKLDEAGEELLALLLASSEPPTLREIKTRLAIKNLDRKLDKLIADGLVIRRDRRYYPNIPTDEEYEELKRTPKTRVIANLEVDGFEVDEGNIATYFEKLDLGLELTPKEQAIFDLIGDVEPNFAIAKITKFHKNPSEKYDIFDEVAKLLDWSKIYEK